MGWKHAVQVMTSVVYWCCKLNVASQIWLLDLPGLGEGEDVIDYLKIQTSPAHQRAALIELVKGAKRWELKEGA